jgi:hypothetical protein
MRTAIPRPYLAFYPALWHQSDIKECVHFVDPEGETESFATCQPPAFEDLGQRQSYDAEPYIQTDLELCNVRLGDIALGRSGDKGANLNFGLFVRSPAQWDWLRSYLSRAKVQELLGTDWKAGYAIERVEFPKIFAVHFVVYGILGRGVSSSKRLDGFGKGFIDYFRDKVVQAPASIIDSATIERKL